MLIKGIDFPEELLRAQGAGELVVFAGAGVSMPAPASLPSFTALAAAIGRGSNLQKDEHEPEDRYLGRLKKAGVHVHEAAARILVNERTKPALLHRYLLQLFLTGHKVRLVTTNFDTHFSTTAAELYEAVETFYAPALPLGDDFSGLVYLHGSAGKDAKRCVLTDEDFGRAYLTQGWASRFLAAMFSRYVVLFVGYSHNDTVMNYLARGLPPVTQKPRFAFSTNDDESLAKWEFLGIRPLIYEKSPEENAHSAIMVSVGEWVSELNRGLLEKAQRIRSIVAAQPPLEGEDADYIKYSLGEKSTWQLFFKYARKPEWISWLETHGFSKRIFDWYAITDEFDRQLAFWLTEHFFVEHSAELMAAIQRNDTRINPHLAWCIWRRLCIRDKEPVGESFSKWVAVLLTQPRQVLSYESWCSLLSSCRLSDDKLASLLLFDFVTKPGILLTEPWHIFEGEQGSEKVEFALNLSNEREHWLSEAWEHLFLPNIAAYAVDLLPVVSANLGAAHNLLQVCGRARRDYDPFRIHRQSIDHSDEHGISHTIDVLVDAAKAILDHLLREKPQQAAAVIDMWLASEAAILRRFAIYGYGLRSDVGADEKLQWLIQNGFVYVFKTDVFEFLKRCYRPASADAKRTLIERVLEGPSGDRLEARTREYEIYNFIVWFNRIAPQCEITQEVFDRLQREHPDFAPREDPELDFWSGGVQSINPTEGFDIDSIASKPADEFLDQFLAFKPRDPMDHRDPSSAVSAVVSKNPNWGLDWVRVLLARGLSDSRFWYCVCQGWRNATLTPEQWAAILEVAETIDAPPEFFSAFAENLENGSRREQNRLPDELMGQAQRVAERIWERVLKLTTVEAADGKDWLTVAINRPGGKLAEFWLQRISVARKAAGESWQGLPAGIASSVAEILRSTGAAAVHARIVFASQLHYFFHLDFTFAQRELQPHFNWKADPLTAEQCWHGYLWWGRWLPGLTEQLLPQFDETLNRLDEMPDDLRRHTISHVAGLALFRFDNPVASGWLTKTVAKLPDSDLDHLASEIDRLLDDTAPAIAEGIWDRWLRNYWEMRLLGTPKPLSQKEATEMVHWAMSVGQRLPDALKLIQQMHGLVQFEHPDLLHRVEQKRIAKAQPQATAELLLFFFKSTPKHFNASDHVENVWTDLKAGGVPAELLKKVREAMLALGHDPEHES